MNQNSKNRKHIITTVGPNDIGKLPPQATDLEEVVLGAMLLEKEAVEAVISILNQESFYKEQNGRVFNAIITLYKKSEPIDILTICKQLQKTEELELVGGAYYVSSLTTRVASSANIEIHARIVQQKQLARDLIRINTMGIKEAYEDETDIFDLYAKQTQETENCLDGIMKYEAQSIGDAHTDSIIEHQEVLKSGKTSGVPTGFKNVDKFTGGWQNSDLIVIGARPGQGKTMFVVACAKNATIIHKIPTVVFSLEMSTEQLTSRIQADISEIELSRVQKKQLNEDEIKRLDFECKELYKAPLYIDDTPALTLLELKTKARKMVNKYKVELIIIDYLQLMSGGNEKAGNREQEISNISRGLKALSKELDIPIIALSQLSRQVESRPGKKPQLSDLRESGAIEQDADMVMFIFRPTYYEQTEYECGGKIFPAEGLFVLIVAKNRHGALGDLILGWIAEYAKLTDYDFDNMRPKWIPKNNITQTNNNLESSNGINTFVQPMNKMDNNTDFLSQSGDGALGELNDIPF